MNRRCPKCKGILNQHAVRCPEPECGWSVVPEDSKVWQGEKLTGLSSKEPCPRCAGTCWFKEDAAGPLVCSKCGWRNGMPTSYSSQVEHGPTVEAFLSKESPEDQEADGPETLKEREWATATRDERFDIVLQMLAAAELTIHNLQEKVESLDKSAASLIRGLHAEIAELKKSLKGDPCLPACECQPAEAEFTVGQMAAAIESVLICVNSIPISFGDRQALWAARDHILAGSRCG